MWRNCIHYHVHMCASIQCEWDFRCVCVCACVCFFSSNANRIRLSIFVIKIMGWIYFNAFHNVTHTCVRVALFVLETTINFGIGYIFGIYTGLFDFRVESRDSMTKSNTPKQQQPQRIYMYVYCRNPAGHHVKYELSKFVNKTRSFRFVNYNPSIQSINLNDNYAISLVENWFQYDGGVWSEIVRHNDK